MEQEKLLEIIQAVSNAGVSDFQFEEGDMKIRISTPTEHNSQAAATSDVSQARHLVLSTEEASILQGKNENTLGQMSDSEEIEGKIVKSPLVGVFYIAPSEDGEPFVTVGDQVKKGQTLAIVEAMKLMNDIESEYDGVLKKILVENGKAVEYGQPLFLLA